MSAQEKTVNDWSWWQAALAGDRQELPSRSPQPGFYRAGQRALAIWYEAVDGSLAWNLTGEGWQPQQVDEATDLFAKACMYPIPQEVWSAVDAGEEWPPHLLVDLTQADLAAKVAWHPAWARQRFDELQQRAREKREAEQARADEAARVAQAKDVSRETEAAGAALPKLGHNSGEPHELARDELNAVLVAFRKWNVETGKIETEAQSLKAKGYQEQANRIRLDAEKKHKAEKAPVLEQARAIDAKWITGSESIVGQAKRLEELIQKERTPFEVAARKARDEEAARLKREQEEQRRQAEKAKANAGAVPEAQFDLTPPEPTRAAAPAKKTTKTVERVVFDDPVAVFTHLAKLSPWQMEANDIAQRVVRKIIAGGTNVPGARIITEEVAR